MYKRRIMILRNRFLTIAAGSVLLAGLMMGCDSTTSVDIDPDAPTIFSTSPDNGERMLRVTKL